MANPKICKNCRNYIYDEDMEITDCEAVEMDQDTFEKYFETNKEGCPFFK